MGDVMVPDPEELAQVMPRANRLWAPYFVGAGRIYRVPAELVAAVCWRESRGGDALRPRGPSGFGDNGHGRGLMQIDDRSHACFLAETDDHGKPLWQYPSHNIDYATREVLAKGLAAFPDSLEGGIAAYNARADRVQMALKNGRHPDSVTTGGDYVAEVLGNALTWHRTIIHDPSECRCRLCGWLAPEDAC
jgi:soluble lytic murein transglycosylase-like protein